MTLYRQLVLAITFLIVCLMAANVVVSVFNARGYVFQQMQVHAQDTATSLGLTISHAAQEKDQAQVELFVSAVFDRGFYRHVSYQSLSGQVSVDRRAPVEVEGVPQWFVDMVDLPVPTGRAEVVSGWLRLGEITVVSHPGFAYKDLWRVFNEQLWLFLVTAVLCYAAAGIGLRLLLRPLRRVEDQAEAICRREFPVQDELPKTRELRRMVSAMNRMVKKIQAMFQEQVELSESLHRQACLDPLTNLSNRRDFDSRLAAFMQSEACGSAGLMLLIQVEGLVELNNEQGREVGDMCLFQVASTLEQHASERQGAIVARRSGADLCAFIPWLAKEEAELWAVDLVEHLQLLSWFNRENMNLHIGAVYDSVINEHSRLLERADMALRQAQHQSSQSLYWYQGDNSSGRTAGQWRSFLLEAIKNRSFSFMVQPVFQRDGDSVEQLEILCRLQDGSRLLSAGVFLPMAERFDMALEIDRLMIDMLSQQCQQVCAAYPQAKVCVNLSTAAMMDDDFGQWLQNFLRAPEQKAFASRLVVELSEHALVIGEAHVRRFGRLLNDVGASLSLDHFGVGAKAFSYLQSLPLLALKVDRCFIQSINMQPDNQFFVKSLLQIAHSCDIQLLAEGVETEQEWRMLLDLGVDGGQGYYLGAPHTP